MVPRNSPKGTRSWNVRHPEDRYSDDVLRRSNYLHTPSWELLFPVTNKYVHRRCYGASWSYEAALNPFRENAYCCREGGGGGGGGSYVAPDLSYGYRGSRRKGGPKVIQGMGMGE